MTTVYFVRHAEPNYNNHDDMTRELTEKGWADRERVTEFLKDKGITKAYSSPFKRSIDTIGDFTEKFKLTVETDYDFRERKVGDGWLDDFDSFAKQQWADFSYKLEHGESLAEVQERNIIRDGPFRPVWGGDNNFYIAYWDGGEIMEVKSGSWVKAVEEEERKLSQENRP